MEALNLHAKAETGGKIGMETCKVLLLFFKITLRI
jgi:hypothetical protein